MENRCKISLYDELRSWERISSGQWK